MTRDPGARERGKFVVLGGGSFGCAMALLLARKGHRVDLLVRKPQVCDQINEQRRNPLHLSEFEFPALVRATTDPAEAFADAQYMCHAVPVQFSRAALTEVKPHIAPDMPILSLSKGIEQGSLSLMCDLLGNIVGDEHPMAFLSGPAFAREIAAELATAVVIASHTPGLAAEFGAILSSDVFRCYYTPDVIGVEVGGAVKNVIAIAAGMCEGLGLGTNAMAALVTRGCSETRRLALALGASAVTIGGLSGVGDTFGTCFGPLSRNRQVGVRLGQGESLREILASSNEVAEGVATSLSVVELIKQNDRSYRLDLKFPILFGVAEILQGKRTPREGLLALMTMPLRIED